MRICFISNPNSMHTSRWVNWFHRRGHTVLLIGDSPMRSSWEGAPLHDLTHNFNLRWVKYPVWIFRTRQILRRFQPDILHCHRLTGAGWIGAFSGFTPLVVTPWGTDLYQFPLRSFPAEKLTRFVLRRAVLVTADSNDLCQQAIQYGAQPNLVHNVQWGVDRQVFHPAETSLAELRDSYNLTADPVVLSIRAIHPIYNLEWMLEGFHLARQHLPNIQLILRDYNIDPVYRQLVAQKIKELGIQEAVKWIGEMEDEAAVAQLYQLADVALSVPFSDGTPVSVLEAMACGTAIIASDLPSLREWISDGHNGRLIALGDTRSLADAIIKLCQNEPLRRIFRLRNSEIIQERADHQREMEKMESLYSSLI
jgi:glycosyltransferase involved in cell wall biosynthesis